MNCIQKELNDILVKYGLAELDELNDDLNRFLEDKLNYAYFEGLKSIDRTEENS